MDTQIYDQQREFIATLRMSGEALLTIINDILDFSKIEAGKMEIERTTFDVRSRVSAILQLFAAPAIERKLSLTSEIAADAPLLLNGDPVRIGQALSDIVANTIGFTHEGGVQIAVVVVARKGEEVTLHFDISDTGIGISEEAIETIFNPFS